jgi:NAD kinase
MKINIKQLRQIIKEEVRKAGKRKLHESMGPGANTTVGDLKSWLAKYSDDTPVIWVPDDTYPGIEVGTLDLDESSNGLSDYPIWLGDDGTILYLYEDEGDFESQVGDDVDFNAGRVMRAPGYHDE